VVFSGFVGGRKEMLPTGNAVDEIDGIEISAIDAGVCAIIADAQAFGIAADESPQELNGNQTLLDHIESVRRRAGFAMGLGDVSGSVLPKVMLVTKSHRGDVQSRYFVPATCHPTHAVSGAICLATAATVPGTVVSRLFGDEFGTGRIVIEHPAGTMDIVVAGAGAGISAAVRSTARKLFDGFVFADLTERGDS
jgi:4-oxalomesaconate tautomerase